MTRLSCRFCVLASRADLICSARLNPELAQRYVDVETRIGHRFRTDLTIAEVVAAASAPTAEPTGLHQLTLFEETLP